MSLVLFDLDGTLVDSAPDMAAALNRLRSELNLPAVDEARVRPYVSRGAMGVLGQCLAEELNDGVKQEHLDRFLEIYASALTVHSTLFPGLDAFLDDLESRGWVWGIVSNKAEHLARGVIEGLNLAARCSVLVGGDTLTERKPHPAPVLHALKALDAVAETTLFVGDDRRDVEAGRAAGCRTVAAGWGYIPPEEDIASWGADLRVDRSEDLQGAVARHG